MSLALKRFEIVLVFIVAMVCAYFASSYLFGGIPGFPGIVLIPQPQVVNEREAILDQLSRTSSVAGASEPERLSVLEDLASTSPAEAPSVEERIDLLDQLSSHTP